MGGEFRDNQISSTLNWKPIKSRPLKRTVFIRVQTRKIFELTHSLVHEVHYVVRIERTLRMLKLRGGFRRNHTRRDKGDFLGS